MSAPASNPFENYLRIIIVVLALLGSICGNAHAQQKSAAQP